MNDHTAEARKLCDAEACTAPARSQSAAYCEKHYYRMRRTGKLSTSSLRRAARGVCTVEDCPQGDAGPHGLCAKHSTRVRRHGDTHTVKTPEARPGELNPNWAGGDVKVKGAHMRLRANYGPASLHLCVDCDRTADHWSYNHTDPNEKQSEYGPYSPEAEHYSPRCVPCHKAFDLAYLADERER